LTCLSISFFNVHFPCHILAAMSWRLNCLLKRFYYSKNWCWLLSYASIIYSCTSSLSLHIVRCIQAFSTSLQITFISFCLTFCHNGVFISYVIIRHCWKINYPDKLNFPYRSCSTEVPVKLIWHLSVSFASAVWHNVDDDVICRTKYHRACRYSSQHTLLHMKIVCNTLMVVCASVDTAIETFFSFFLFIGNAMHCACYVIHFYALYYVLIYYSFEYDAAFLK